MNKKCTHCGLEKHLDCFSNDRKYKSSYCKDCANERSKKRHQNKMKESKLNYWVIYYLPEEHRIGITDNPWNRMRNHKYRHKRNIDGWRVLQTANTLEKAKEYELMFAGTLAINGVN